jgi:hypothetical protein
MDLDPQHPVLRHQYHRLDQRPDRFPHLVDTSKNLADESDL